MPSQFRLDLSPKRAAVLFLAATTIFAAPPTTSPTSKPPAPPAPSIVAPRVRPGAPFPAPPYAPHAPDELIVKFRDGVEP
jgi:hypothetical protein